MLFWFVISDDGIIRIRKSVWFKENSKYIKDMHEVMIQSILYYFMLYHFFEFNVKLVDEQRTSFSNVFRWILHPFDYTNHALVIVDVW
jgi:hypothetical protein